MSDCELLEQAAKAAGIKYDTKRSAPNKESGSYFGLWLEIEGEPNEFTRRYWNPLTDDGDALRLATKLGLSIQFDRAPSTTMTLGKPLRVCVWGLGWHREDINDHWGSATRRVIVQAAADLGRNMT